MQKYDNLITTKILYHRLCTSVNRGRNILKIIQSAKWQTREEGDYVRVKLGPMRGMEGYVRREGPNATICLNVEILGSAVEMAISPEDLEKISPA